MTKLFQIFRSSTAVSALFVSSVVIACPKGAPDGFTLTPGQTERSYNDAAKLVEVVVKCDERVKPTEAMKALKMIGSVRVVDATVSFVELPGSHRMYVGTNGGNVTQVAVTAKTSEDLSKVSPAILEFLKSK